MQLIRAGLLAATSPLLETPPSTTPFIRGVGGGAGVQGQPLVDLRAVLGRGDDDGAEGVLLDLENMLVDGDGGDAELLRDFRDRRVLVLVQLVLHQDTEDLALTLRQAAKVVRGDHAGAISAIEYEASRLICTCDSDSRVFYSPRLYAGGSDGRDDHRREADRGGGPRGAPAPHRGPEGAGCDARARGGDRRGRPRPPPVREDEVPGVRGDGPPLCDPAARGGHDGGPPPPGGREGGRGPRDPWDPRPAAPAPAHLHDARGVLRRRGEGRGLLPPGERRPRPDRHPEVRARDALRGRRAPPSERERPRWEARRDLGPEQHRREAPRGPPGAEGGGPERGRHGVPLLDAGPPRDREDRGHPRRRDRAGGVRHGGDGEARGRRDRRRDQPRPGSDEKAGVPHRWRREVLRGERG